MTDSFIARAALLLHTGRAGNPFPANTEFSELELESYENSLVTLAVRLLRTPEISATIWIPPVKYSYQYADGETRTRWSWLEKFYIGLKASKEFFSSFIEDVPQYETYKIEIKDSEGVAISFGHGNSSANIIDGLNSNELGAIADELKSLRERLKLQSTTVNHDIAIASIASAEIAARNNDRKGVIENLKKAGTWVFDVSTKIGVSVVSKLIGDLIKPA